MDPVKCWSIFCNSLFILRAEQLTPILFLEKKKLFIVVWIFYKYMIWISQVFDNIYFSVFHLYFKEQVEANWERISTQPTSGMKKK